VAYLLNGPDMRAIQEAITTLHLTDPSGWARAKQVLCDKEPGMLAYHTHDLVALLKSPNWEVRVAAVAAIGKLPEKPLEEQCADPLIELVEDAEEKVRKEAVEALSRLDPAALSKHVGTILRVLDRHSLSSMEYGLRRTASQLLLKLDPAALEPHAARFISVWCAHHDVQVQTVALQVVRQFDPAVLAEHSQPVMALLKKNKQVAVRHAMADVMSKLDTEVLETHADDVLSILDDENGEVRGAIVTALGKLTVPTLAAANFWDTVAKVDNDTDEHVRKAAAPLLLKRDQVTLAANRLKRRIRARNHARLPPAHEEIV